MNGHIESFGGSVRDWKSLYSTGEPKRKKIIALYNLYIECTYEELHAVMYSLHILNDHIIVLKMNYTCILQFKKKSQ